MGELYKQQVKEGRWFLHIHPASATSWSLKEITDVMDREGLDVTAADQCMFGLKTATIGVARPTCGSVPVGLAQGDLYWPHEGAAQQGVPREEDA